MSNIGRRPLRGYLQLLDGPPLGPAAPNVPRAFVFSYNPTEVTHIFLYDNSALSAPAHGGPVPISLRLPCELFFLSVEMDVTDQLEDPNTNWSEANYGLFPRFAKLQWMAKPQTSATGQVEMPAFAFSWGSNRVAPVRLLNVKITEEAFDPMLNPIRAKVEMWLKVLEKDEVKTGTQASHIWGIYDNQQLLLADKYLPEVTGIPGIPK